MRSRSSTTPHLPSYFLPITSIQLFHHQSYGHTFPIPNEPTKAEVHQIPSHPAMICIELPHSFSLFTVLDGSPIDFYLVPYVAILSRLLILILPLILFRHFQKFSKLLHPLWLHFPSIQGFSIGLQPVEHIMLLNSMLRWIPMIGFYEISHLFISFHPSFVLCHTDVIFLLEIHDQASRV